MRRTAERSTRGRTRSGRLQHLDLWVERQLRPTGLVFDVGVGWHPFTTVELAEALPACQVVGVEIDAERVEAARAAEPTLEIRQGGFDLPIHPGERPTLVRAMNLLRQYHPDRAATALDSLARPLAVGGWLVDGRTDATGERMVARLHVRTATGRRAVALLCHTTFVGGFGTRMFQHLLPKDLGGPHHPIPRIADLLRDWEVAVRDARSAGHREPPATFREAARRLDGVVHDPAGWSAGYLAFWSLGVHRSIAPK